MTDTKNYTSPVSNRIQKIIDENCMSGNSFAQSLGVDSANFSRFMRNGNMPRMTLVKIANKYNVGLEWLRDGTGEKHPAKSTTQIIRGNDNNQGLGDNIIGMATESETIAAMRDTIAALKAQVADKDLIISLLKAGVKLPE